MKKSSFNQFSFILFFFVVFGSFTFSAYPGQAIWINPIGLEAGEKPFEVQFHAIQKGSQQKAISSLDIPPNSILTPEKFDKILESASNNRALYLTQFQQIPYPESIENLLENSSTQMSLGQLFPRQLLELEENSPEFMYNIEAVLLNQKYLDGDSRKEEKSLKDFTINLINPKEITIHGTYKIKEFSELKPALLNGEIVLAIPITVPNNGPSHYLSISHSDKTLYFDFIYLLYNLYLEPKGLFPKILGLHIPPLQQSREQLAYVIIRAPQISEISSKSLNLENLKKLELEVFQNPFLIQNTLVNTFYDFQDHISNLKKNLGSTYAHVFNNISRLESRNQSIITGDQYYKATSPLKLLEHYLLKGRTDFILFLNQGKFQMLDDISGGFLFVFKPDRENLKSQLGSVPPNSKFGRFTLFRLFVLNLLFSNPESRSLGESYLKFLNNKDPKLIQNLKDLQTELMRNASYFLNRNPPIEKWIGHRFKVLTEASPRELKLKLSELSQESLMRNTKTQENCNNILKFQKK